MPQPSANAAPPPLPQDHQDYRAARILDLREGFDWARFVATFLPLVHGVASVTIPEDAAAVERVTAAVFNLFRQRQQKIPKRRLASRWLVQATLLAARQERRQRQLPSKLVTPAQKVMRSLDRLPLKLHSAVLLCSVLQLSPSAAALVLQTKETHVLKRNQAGLAKLQRRVRKTGARAEALLHETASPLAEETTQRLLLAIEAPADTAPLVRQTLSSWRWLNFRCAFKRVFKAVAGILAVLAMLAATFVYLATHGYLTAFFITMGQRQALKEFPEMRDPARPWPAADSDRTLARTNPPHTGDDLFQITNVWPVTLSFTPEEWKKLEPARVPPVRNVFQEGRIILRNPQAKRSGLSGVLGFEFNWGEARLNFAGKEFPRVGVRYRGNGTYLNSLYGAKQSLKLDVAKYEKSARLGGIQELNFLNTVVDYSYLHDALGQQLFRELGTVGPRTAYAYITVEIREETTPRIEPRGLFVAVENIDGDFAENRFGTKKAPIFKPVTYDLFEDLGDDWAAYKTIYDLKTKATPEQEKRVIQFSKLVSHATDDEFARQLPEYLDLDEFAGFLGGHVLLSSYDGFLVNGQNYYLYLDPRSNKFGFVSWDQDHAWGDFGHIGKTEERENASIWQPSTYQFRFLERVLKVEAFRAIYRQKLDHALAHSFSKEKLYPEIDLIAGRIRPAVAAESAFRLKRFDKAVSSEWEPGPRDGEAEGPKAPIHQLKRFIENRARSVRDQLDGKSEGARLNSFR